MLQYQRKIFSIYLYPNIYLHFHFSLQSCNWNLDNTIILFLNAKMFQLKSKFCSPSNIFKIHVNISINNITKWKISYAYKSFTTIIIIRESLKEKHNTFMNMDHPIFQYMKLFTLTKTSNFYEVHKQYKTFYYYSYPWIGRMWKVKKIW